jgi:hypothetical protein
MTTIRMIKLTLFALITAMVAPSCQSVNNKEDKQEVVVSDTSAFLDDLKLKTFTYFWEVVDTTTWQHDDRHPTRNFTSIAATGFALPAYIIGVENAFIDRGQAAERVLHTLRWLWNSPQGPEAQGMTGYKGLFYHFLNYSSGTRFKDVELSTIDSGLLFGGILVCQSYFDQNDAIEKEIRQLADSLFLRAEWDWAMNESGTMSMGWKPESGFIKSSWTGYNEAMLLIAMAMGSPTHPIPDNAWDKWCETYEWCNYYGYEHVNFGPLFGHQYSHMFIDFRGIYDDYMREKGIDYFENSRRATLANRAYCMDNPKGFKAYSETIWGLTASDGPGYTTILVGNDSIRIREYHARGVACGYLEDDGTIAPTAAGGSIPFAPEYCIPALMFMKETYGEKLYDRYGFKDAFNPSFSEEGWFAPDYIGIDQGAILIQIENYQTGLINNLMKKNKYIRNGLLKAGFTSGWLEEDIQYGTKKSTL